MAEHNVINHPTLNEESPIKLSDVKTKEDLMKFIKQNRMDPKDCCFCENCLNRSLTPDMKYLLTRIYAVMLEGGIFLGD